MTAKDFGAMFRWMRERPRRVLAIAFVASIAAHLLATFAPAPAPAPIESLPPLTATITELPPPPVPTPQPAPKVKPKRKAVAAARPALTAPQVPVESLPSDYVATGDPLPAPPETTAPPSEIAELAAPIAEPAPPIEEPAAPIAQAPPPKELPPRIDLVYRAFLGTRGFFIGDAVYRLEHEGERYTISTVGQARGLAALFIRGEGRLTSTGTITPHGLQPMLYTAERTSDNRHEMASFDWQAGVVLLNDHKSADLDAPTFDPLTVLWQFYFVPPTQDESAFNIATTRRVYHYVFHRAGTEVIKLPLGDVDTEVWQRDGGDGNLEARVWLAPSLHHVAVKVRLTNSRATVEALLDSIRVDETFAQR